MQTHPTTQPNTASSQNDADAYSRLSEEKARSGFEDGIILNDPSRYKLPKDCAVAAIDVVNKQALVFKTIERAATKLCVDESIIATLMVHNNDETTVSLRTRTEWGFREIPIRGTATTICDDVRKPTDDASAASSSGSAQSIATRDTCQSIESSISDDSGESSEETTISSDSSSSSSSHASSTLDALPGENEYIKMTTIDSPINNPDTTFALPPSPIREYSPDEARDEVGVSPNKRRRLVNVL